MEKYSLLPEQIELLASKSNISTDVVEGSVSEGDPPAIKILPFSEAVLCKGSRNVVP